MARGDPTDPKREIRIWTRIFPLFSQRVLLSSHVLKTIGGCKTQGEWPKNTHMNHKWKFEDYFFWMRHKKWSKNGPLENGKKQLQGTDQAETSGYFPFFWSGHSLVVLAIPSRLLAVSAFASIQDFLTLAIPHVNGLRSKQKPIDQIPTYLMKSHPPFQTCITQGLLLMSFLLQTSRTTIATQSSSHVATGLITKISAAIKCL